MQLFRPAPPVEPSSAPEKDGPTRNDSASDLLDSDVPVLGWTSAAWLISLFGLQIGLAPPSPDLSLTVAAWLGVMWSGLSIATWILAHGRRSLFAYSLLVGCLGWHVYWMHSVMQQPLERYILSMGGLVVVQALCGHLLVVPVWRCRIGGEPPVPYPWRRQFGIATLLVLTLVSAFIFAAVKDYQTPDPLHYWGTATVAVGLAAIAISGQRALFARRYRATLATLFVVLTGVVFWSITALAEVRDANFYSGTPTPKSATTFCILLVFAAGILGAGLCGHCDRACGVKRSR